MQVGDLIKTHRGNIALITKVGKDWCNILFLSSGHHRTGFPIEWIRVIK
tara:strand:+ start:579 stop:725 length:147 start_codon:yes stop_codon:yes gene_type:complete